MKRWQVLALAAFLLISYSLVNNMDIKQQQREEAWAESVQAVEIEQENIQSRIRELQEQYKDIEELYICQGILLDDVRTRLHFELFEELEGY